MSASAASAGAWSQPENGFFLRLASKAYFASGYFNAAGARVPGDWWESTAKFDEVSLNLIAELGLLERLTLTLETTGKSMHSDYPEELRDDPMAEFEQPHTDIRVTGISDVVLGARYGFWQKAVVAAVGAQAVVPAGYSRVAEHVSLGNAEYAGQLSLLVGGSLPVRLPRGSYFDANAGFRMRSGGSGELTGGGSVGVEVLERVWARVGASGLYNLSGGSMVRRGQPPFASYLGVGGAVTYLFQSGLGIELGASVDALGKNTFSGWAAELVVQYSSKS